MSETWTHPTADAPMEPRRCAWATSALAIRYHDEEWGVPHHVDRALFELLVLEGAQAGLSWETILRKRARYREVFDQFDPAAVASYGPAKVGALPAEPRIVPNPPKNPPPHQNPRALPPIRHEAGA